jgi:hypothetical protein
MVRKVLVIGILVLLVTVATAGLYARSQGAVVPWLGGPPIETVVGQAIATKDSIAVATFAVDRCKLLRGKTRQRCYEEILLAMVEQEQVRLAMDAMSVLSRMDPGTQRYGHDLAHVVGINGWTPKRNVSHVYESCTGLYQSGCYHGVVQAFLDARGTDSATVAALCNQIKPAVFNMWLRFQCVHGLGHGLVNNLNHHLPKALAGCDWLIDAWDAQSCYGGAFMEFIVEGRGQAHHPHKSHAPATDHDVAAAGGTPPEPGDHAAGAGHDHGAASDSFAYRDKTDPLYPCTAIDTKYQASCYGMQAGIIIELTGPDFGKIAAACDDAPTSMQPSCYQGVGTYVSGYTVRDPEKSIRLCAMGNDKLQTWCYVGVVKNFIDVTANPIDGFDFCRRLTNRTYAVGCYNAVGEEMSVLYRDLPAREQQCAKAPPDFAPACRYGATLSNERPKELTSFIPAT